MARKELFTTIRTEGAILPSDLLQRIGDLDKALPGLRPADYGLAPTERINEAIARSWSRLQGLWIALREEREKLGDDDPALALTRERWLLPLFDELGYGQLKPRKASDDAPISHAHGEVPFHLLGVGVPLDRRTPKVPGAAKRSPHALVQDYLNGTDKALYGFVSNGRSLRLLRDNSSLTRQAFVEFDVEGMFEGEVYPDFSLLWLTCHATRVDGDPPATCLLERWSQAAAEQGARALDRLREGVKDALVALGGGFLRHPANQNLKEALRAGDLSAQDYYRELLRVVYRLLFLFVAEDREVLHPPEASEQARARYARHFSTRRLRELARRHRGGRHPDLWQALEVVLRALGDPDGLPGIGLPSLGGLFAPGQSPNTDRAQMANHELLTAVRALAFTREGRVVRAVDYRNLGPEEFGSVYESLLELHPEVEVDAGTFGFLEAAGSERKTTGSYYTPPSLVQALLDSALDPVIERAAAAADPEAEILSRRVVDPASGSGHFLIAAAHRLALRLAAVRSGEGSPAPEEVRRALRDVVGRCIYGVDVNPMAVELCKVSLWIEAVEPGKPLSFLDAHIRCGNSLVGATPGMVESGVPLEAFNAITGDDKEVAKERKAAERKRQQKGGVTFAEGAAAERLAALRAEAARITALPDDTPRAVAAKADAYASFITSEPFQAAGAAFDSWCSAFYLPKTDDSPEVGSDTVAALLAGHDVEASVRAAVEQSARQNRFFHWQLEFPDVMSNGGFDCVLGNPPWETVEVDVEHDAEAKQRVESLQAFLSHSRRFPLTGGRRNLYGLFAELVFEVCSPHGGIGIIVPTGIVTETPMQRFCEEVVAKQLLVSLFDFENRADSFFEGASRQRFCLMTCRPQVGAAAAPCFGFNLGHPADISDPERTWSLNADDVRLMSPMRFAIPAFRSRRDMQVAQGAYARNPTLHSSFEMGALDSVLLLNFDRNSPKFKSDSQSELDAQTEATYPVYEGEYLHAFDHRFAFFEGGEVKRSMASNRQDASWRPRTRWVTSYERLTERWKGLKIAPEPYVGMRRHARASDERTTIAAVLPESLSEGSVSCFFSPHGKPRAHALLCGTLNSFAFDFLLRLRLTSANPNKSVYGQIPMPLVIGAELEGGGVPQSAERLAGIVARVLELSYTSWDLESFARALGYEGPPFRWDPERRFLLRAELDAAFFHLYGISRDDASYILDSFPIVRASDERKHGSYRTKGVVLDLYDRMAIAADKGEPYQTVLHPPPADPSVAHPASTRRAWAIPPGPPAPVAPVLRLVASPPKGKARERYAPVVNLKAAAGGFGAVQEVEPEGWVKLPGSARATGGAFVALVVGRSMEPTIPNEAWCLFGPPPAGSRTGKILLVQHRDIADPETGGSFTIKRYRSEKAEDSDTLWRHARIILEPDNPEFEPIVLEPGNEEDVKIVGEFLRVIESAFPVPRA